MEGRVWTLGELSILNEIHTPIAIIVSGLYESSHSSGNLADVARVIFQNTDCRDRFGMPRPAEEFKEHMAKLTEEERRSRRAWLLKTVQGQVVNQTSANISNLLRPIFKGITIGSFQNCISIDSKPIRVQTANGQVEEALLHIAEVNNKAADLRAVAAHLQDVMQIMVFGSQGNLLNANKAAWEAFHGRSTGEEEEGQAVYEEALDAIFNLKVDCHCHEQCHISQKDGSIKWAALEMWPMQDPVDGSPALLLKRFDITQQKDMELQLASQQVNLQRKNQLLEEASVTMQEEQDRLQHQASSLADRLHAVMEEKRHRRLSFDAETPVDKTLNYLQSVVSGITPSVEVALELFNMLSRSDTKLRQPVGLETQLLQDMRMDSDVSRSMLQLLQGSSTQPALSSTEPPVLQMSTHPDNLKYGPVAQAYPPQAPSLPQQFARFVPSPITLPVESMLKDAENNWQFDVFRFAKTAPGNTLSLLTFHLFTQAGLIERFDLDPEKLFRFFQKVEAGYSSGNPYHNGTHATAVLQMSHMILWHGGAMQGGPAAALQIASTYWSAAVHDFQHGGVNNDFLIKTAHPLAITYNDQSPLENHHLAAATVENLQPEHLYTPVKLLRTEEFMSFRQTNTSMVLGTDMKKHFDIMSRFQISFQRVSGGSSDSVAPSNLDWSSLKNEDKTLVHQMLLKCADIGHLAAPPASHKRWALQLEEEFFQQGDQEKAVGLPISPLMDRTLKGGMTRSQVGFFNIVGIPLFKAMVSLFPNAQPILDGALVNYHEWEKAAQATS